MLVRIHRYELLLAGVVYLLPGIAFAIAYVLRFVLLHPTAPMHGGVLSPLLVTTLIWGVVAAYRRLYSLEILLQERIGIARPVESVGTTYLLVATSLYFAHAVNVSRGLLLLQAIILIVLTIVVRVYFRKEIAVLSAAQHPLRVLMVGTDELARNCARRLHRIPLAPGMVVGYIHLPGHAIKVKGAPIYEAEDIPSVDPSQIDDVVLAVPLRQYEEMPGVITEIEKLCRPIRAVLDFGRRFVLREKVLQLGQMQVFDIGRTPTESFQYLVWKRVFDIVFASFAVLICSPVMIGIALAVKLTSRGPVLFCQERIGYNGVRFKMFKFRSMKLNKADNSSYTAQNDPRITGIGKFIRKTSLDELPQFFNVIRGDMSVVGPRPEQPYFVRKLRHEIPAYMSRHTIKCGITGWAQVNGLRGSDTSIPKRVQYDLDYIRNWSFRLDLKIIYLTIATGFAGRNAF